MSQLTPPPSGFFQSSPSSNPWVHRVFVMDDHAFFAGALASLINSEADLAVCGITSKPAGFYELVVQSAPDILIMDVNMSARDNWALAVAVRRWSKIVPILFASSLQNPRMEHSLGWLEPCSFVEKNRDPAEIVKAIRSVLGKGRSPASQPLQKT